MTAVPPPEDIKTQSLPSAADEKLKQMREAYYRRVLDEAAARRKLIPRNPFSATRRRHDDRHNR